MNPLTLVLTLAQMVMVIIAVVSHEMAHAYTSHFLGDPTPKETGRLTPNPLKHIDMFGLICMLLFRVGWAKPVMINSEYYKNRRVGTFLVALAGPLMNFVLATLAIIASVLYNRFVNIGDNLGLNIIDMLIYLFASVNISLCIFNLIPIPPLDGSRLVGSFLSANAYIGYMKIQRYGFFIVMGLLLLDSLLATFTGGQKLFPQLIQYIFNGLYYVISLVLG